MTYPNTDPIYSKQGDIQWSAPILTAANDYTCFSALNVELFEANEENGGFVQRLRFKPLGTNVASVMRLYINNGLANQQIITASGTPAGTPSASNGTINTSSLYGKIVPVGLGGDVGVASAESAAVSVTGPTGSVLWSWTAPSGFTVGAYRLHIGIATGAQTEFFFAPNSTVVASQSTTILTVTSITSAPDKRVCAALQVGSVFASGIAAGTYIINQLTSAEADGSFGRTGTYTLSASATVTSQACATDPLKYEQLIPAHQMNQFVGGIPQPVAYDGQVSLNNCQFYGEISLPATTANAALANPDIDYQLNFALPAGFEIYAGLGTAVAAGWQVGVVGGKYGD